MNAAGLSKRRLFPHELVNEEHCEIDFFLCHAEVATSNSTCFIARNQLVLRVFIVVLKSPQNNGNAVRLAGFLRAMEPF